MHNLQSNDQAEDGAQSSSEESQAPLLDPQVQGGTQAPNEEPQVPRSTKIRCSSRVQVDNTCNFFFNGGHCYFCPLGGVISRTC